jgi:hypothetical protein
MMKERYKPDMADEIVDYAKALPFECQEQILAVAKGMDFAARCVLRQMKAEKAAEPVFEANAVPAGV